MSLTSSSVFLLSSSKRSLTHFLIYLIALARHWENSPVGLPPATPRADPAALPPTTAPHPTRRQLPPARARWGALDAAIAPQHHPATASSAASVTRLGGAAFFIASRRQGGAGRAAIHPLSPPSCRPRSPQPGQCLEPLSARAEQARNPRSARPVQGHTAAQLPAPTAAASELLDVPRISFLRCVWGCSV